MKYTQIVSERLGQPSHPCDEGSLTTTRDRFPKRMEEKCDAVGMTITPKVRG